MMALSEERLENEIKVRRYYAKTWVREAYQIASKAQPNITISVKTDAYGRGTFLTETDTKVEKFLVAKIREVFPQDAIIGEEGANVPVTAGCFCWIIDSIDGTDNFACRLSPWAVSVGVMFEGMPVVAAVVVHDPALPHGQRVLSTQRGSGFVQCGGKVLLEWGARRPPGRWILGMEGLKRITGGEQIAKRMWALAHQTRTLSSFIGQSAFVLLGHIDGHIEGYCGLWDIVAVDLLAREAGLKCTRWNGTPVFPHAWDVAMKDLPAYRGNYGQFDVIVAPAAVHERLLEILVPYAGEMERDAAKKLAEKKTGG